jgi:phosphonoacetate hydrolase
MRNTVMIPIVLVCLDGISWDYIHSSSTPNLRDVERNGKSATCKSMIPTVTNVNNASILTGEFPAGHGITGNYCFDEPTQSETYMDSPRFLTCSTLLEKAGPKGFSTLLVTVKDKLRRLLSRGVTASFSVENPPAWAVKEIGRPPNIYSRDANVWLLEATTRVLEKRHYDIVYVSTTDYIPHKYEPKCAEAMEHMERIDEKLGKIADKAVLGVVADHGMNEKCVKVDVVKLLEEFNIASRVIPIIKDEHVEHHQNLGGSVYLYVQKDVDKALSILQDAEGVEKAYARRKASRTYRLPPDRIGDVFLLGNKDAVFGPVGKGLVEDVDIRSHGSLHELDVPFITNCKIEIAEKPLNKDALEALLSNI